jgi:putative flippase GtrA
MPFTLKLLSKSLVLEWIKFGFVGIFITIFYSLSLFFLLEFNFFHHQLSNIIVLACSSLMSFYGHKYITFRSINKNTSNQLKKFIFQVFITFCVSSFMLSSLLDLGIPNYIVVTSITLIIPVINYILMKFWIFK